MLFYKKIYPFVYQFRRLSGRNSSGKITTWHRCGLAFAVGVRSFFRVGTFQVLSQVLPTNTRHAVTFYGVTSTGSIACLPAVRNLTRYVINSLQPALNINGYHMPLKYVQVGLRVARVSFYARAGGTSLQILRHRQGYTQVKLPSKRQLWVKSTELCVVGQNANSRVKFIRYQKAGSLLRLGRRPRVRGVAMNPVDHPHGGGQGKTSGLGYSPWGQLSKGYRSRPPHRHGFQPPKFEQTSLLSTARKTNF